MGSTKTSFVVASGVLIAVFITTVGLYLNNIGQLNSEPYGDYGQAALFITLATSLGYNLGLAMRKDDPERIAFVFWASLLGAFLAIAVALSLYILVLELSVVNLLVVIVLISGTSGFSTLIQSGVVESSRMRFLKRGLDIFSNRISAGIFGGYATATVTDYTVGGAVAVLIVIGIPLGTVIVKSALETKPPKSTPRW